MSIALRPRGVERWSLMGFEERVLEVPHQGVLLRDGSVARHLSALFGAHGAVGPRPARAQSVSRRAVVVDVMPIPSSLGVVSELHATARCWRQRISPSRRP